MRKQLYFLALALPLLAAAQVTPRIQPPPFTPGPIQSPSQIINLVNVILSWVATIFWIAAIIFIFYAAYLYLTAGGNDEQISKAHKQLIWSIVAIAVGLMAFGLPLLIENTLYAGGGYFICILGFCF